MRDFLIHTAERAGKSLLANFGTVLKKSKKDDFGDIVTNADFEAEKIIISAIKKKFPRDNILSEEAGYTKKDSIYTWIIDPLDGTKNFSRGVNLFGTTIALACKDKIIEGVIYDPAHQEIYYAKKGKGAYLNNKKIKTNQRQTLNHFIGGVANVRSKTNNVYYNRLKNEFYKKSAGWRVLGSAVLDLSWVSCGRMDMFILGGVCPWDVASGGLIVQEAGGIIKQINGKAWKPFQDKQEIIVCANKNIYREAINIIK